MAAATPGRPGNDGRRRALETEGPANRMTKMQRTLAAAAVALGLSCGACAAQPAGAPAMSFPTAKGAMIMSAALGMNVNQTSSRVPAGRET